MRRTPPKSKIYNRYGRKIGSGKGRPLPPDAVNWQVVCEKICNFPAANTKN